MNKVEKFADKVKYLSLMFKIQIFTRYRFNKDIKTKKHYLVKPIDWGINYEI